MSRDCVENGKEYLLTRIENGLCLEFHQLRHGPSTAWTTACIGSTLNEFRAVPKGMLEAVLSLQSHSGGWSYNQNALPDPDSTLRVLQFLSKLGFRNKVVIKKAEQFVIAHQQSDGGIATYLPETVKAMGYPEGGWTVSHPCVTALACHVLQDEQAQRNARRYIDERLARGDARSYWWLTPWYVRYESGCLNGEDIGEDVVEIALALLLKAKVGIPDSLLQTKLAKMQLDDGSFPASHQFRIPRPMQYLDDISDQVETVEDQTRIFSTAAAVVAISRHEVLLN